MLKSLLANYPVLFFFSIVKRLNESHSYSHSHSETNMNEELLRCENMLNEVTDSISKAFVTVENLMFQRNGESMLELEIFFCCTRRKVEFFVPFNSLPNCEIFPSYAWLLKNEKTVMKSKCLQKFFRPNGRFAISMIISDNLPICVRSMHFSVYDINRKVLYHQRLFNGFSCFVQTIKNCVRMKPPKKYVISYHRLKLFRKHLEESPNFSNSCSINRMTLKMIQDWYSDNLSTDTIKDVPTDYVCPITLEPMKSMTESIIKLYLPADSNEIISFQGLTDKIRQNIQNVKWKPSFYYRRCDIQQHFNSQLYPLTNWEPWSPLTHMDDSGRGGKPGHKEFYLKTPHNLLLLIDANYDPDHMLTRSNYTAFMMAPIKHHQRVGGVFSNTLAVGEEHGALPGHTIYVLIPILES